MEYFAELNFGAHDENFCSIQNTIEIQVKVSFEESFPFKELDELISIVENITPRERLPILSKALNVVKKMKVKFSNSMSPEYETWLVKVENAITKLNQLSEARQSSSLISDNQI